MSRKEREATRKMVRFESRAGAVWVMAAVLAAGMGASPVLGQITQGSITAHLEPVASGLTAPIYAANPGDGTNRMFILEQRGRIMVLENGVVQPTPFLDVSSQLPTLNAAFDERGLLGLAFHPDYANNGKFYVRYSAPRPGAAGEPCFGTSRGCHEEVLAEYTVSANPNIANPTGNTLFRVNEPQFNHNGGQVAFGPDGYLYFSLGDGGGAHDGLADSPPSHGPIGNGQNINTPLGKVLRIDVNGPAPYGIPADNPFVGQDGLDEIYAHGFRNPYRFSFDRGPGNRMFLGDVGQAIKEEVDVVTNGGNYGWVTKEGTNCFDPFNPSVPLPMCDSAGLIDPVAEYDHPEGLAIVGGFVYRGSLFPELYGKYIFGDWSRSFGAADGRLFYLDADGDMSQVHEFQLTARGLPLSKFVMGFGEDENGEIYLLTSSAGGPLAAGAGEMFHITPEPTSLALLLAGSFGVWRRRRV